jgi:hypothetical protein
MEMTRHSLIISVLETDSDRGSIRCSMENGDK